MKLASILCIFLVFVLNTTTNSATTPIRIPSGYKYSGQRFGLDDFRVEPSTFRDSTIPMTLLSDGKCSYNNSYPFPWIKGNRQPITVTANLVGKNKRLDQLVIEQQFGCSDITNAEVWIKTKKKSMFIGSLDATSTTERIFFTLNNPIKKPTEIKLRIRGDSSSRSTKLYVGDIVCLTLKKPTNILVKEFNSLFEDKLGTLLKANIDLKYIQSLQIPSLRLVAAYYYNKTHQTNGNPRYTPSLITLNARECVDFLFLTHQLS